MRYFCLLVVVLGWPADVGAQPLTRTCTRPEVATGLPGSTPPPSRPFPCTQAQYDDIEATRARQQDIMERAARYHRQHQAEIAAARQPGSVDAKLANPCARTEYAALIIRRINVARGAHYRRDQVVDIERIATTGHDPATKAMTCRATVITAQGKRLTGTVEMRDNVAGYPIAIWKEGG